MSERLPHDFLVAFQRFAPEPYRSSDIVSFASATYSWRELVRSVSRAAVSISAVDIRCCPTNCQFPIRQHGLALFHPYPVPGFLLLIHRSTHPTDTSIQ